MNNTLINYLNCDEVLNANIDKLVEIFANYYGDEKKEEIKKKFESTVLIAYSTPKERKRLIRKLETNATREILEKQIKLSKTSLSLEELTDKKTFTDYKYQPLYYYYDFYRLYNLSKEERKKEYLKESFEKLKNYLPELTKKEYKEMVKTGMIPEKYKKIKPWIYNNLEYYIDINNADEKLNDAFNKAKILLNKIDSSITLENFHEYLDNENIISLNKIVEAYPEMLEEYRNVTVPTKEIQEEEASYDRKRQELSGRYYKNYVLQNLDIIPEDKRENVREYILTSSNDYETKKFIENFFGTSITSNQPLDAFSYEATRILEDKNASNWRKRTIKEQRIKYYKQLGIDLGDNYEDYINNSEVAANTPKQERVQRLIESRNNLLNQMNIELFNSYEQTNRIRQRITSSGLIDKDDSFDARILNEDKISTFISPNITKKDEDYVASPLLILQVSDSNHLDHDLIHELNHVYELSLTSIAHDNYEGYCGWDIWKGTISNSQHDVSTINPDKVIRPYELFNEVINEMITQEIEEKAHEAGIYIFDREETSEIKNQTSYEHTIFLVKDFFNEYKEKIIESRVNGNIQIIWDEVGKNNFEGLNELVNLFNENFNSFELLNLSNDIKANKETERTKLYKELIERKDKILENMRKYKMLHDQEYKQQSVEKQEKTNH